MYVSFGFFLIILIKKSSHSFISCYINSTYYLLLLVQNRLVTCYTNEMLVGRGDDDATSADRFIGGGGSSKDQ